MRNLKQLLDEVFCDIRNNNEGREKCYHPKPKAEADNTYRDFDYSGYQKTDSNNCFIIHCLIKQRQNNALLMKRTDKTCFTSLCARRHSLSVYLRVINVRSIQQYSTLKHFINSKKDSKGLLSTNSDNCVRPRTLK